MQGDEVVGAAGGRWGLAERRAALEGARVALAGLDEVLFEASGAELGPLLGLVDDVVAAAELGRVVVTGEALARGEIGVRGAPLSPAQWVLAHAPSTRAGGAAQVVSVAADFAKPANAAVVRATASGRIGVRSAAAVLGEADKLRPMLVDGAHEPVLEGLIAMAEQHGPRGCRMVRPRLLAEFGGVGVLQREQDAARTFVALSQPRECGSGIFEYALTLDAEGMAVVEGALGPLAAPRPTDGERDLRSSDRRRGDALIALVRRAVQAGDSVPTTTKAQLFVTVDYDRLRTRLGGDAEPDTGLAAGEVSGGTQSGTLLAPETVRRIGCDATVIPLVLGSDAEILDWGRARRLFSPAQTKRLWLRDGGCTYPGCDAPAQWCDAHHLVHWADFGPSDLGNAALLCEHHHGLVHRRRLAGVLTSDPDPDGGSHVCWDLTLGSYDHLLARRAAAEPA
jgi:hypothetical protein